MIEGAMFGVGFFLAGVLTGYELCRKARTGKPAVGPLFKRKKDEASEPQRVHPGSFKL